MLTSLFDFSNEDGDLIEFISKNKESLKKDFQQKLATQEETLKFIFSGLTEAKKQKLKSVECIWNVAGYINTCSLDLSVTGEALILEPDPWKRRFYSRMAATNIFEATIDIPNMVGKKFRTQVITLPGGSQFLDDLGNVVKQLSKFKSNHSSWLKDIRICCSAHRDQDLGEQLRVVFEINPTQVLTIMAEFDSLLNALGEVLQSGMNLLPEKKLF